MRGGLSNGEPSGPSIFSANLQDYMDNSRELALQILSRIESGQAYAAIVLDVELGKSSLEARDKALVTELVYGIVRWRKTLDWYLGQVCKKPLRKTHPWLRSLLRLGAYQIIFLDKIPVSAAINESVKLAGKYGKRAGFRGQQAKGFVNGVLRTLARSQDSLVSPETLTDPVAGLAATYSFPEWLIRRWIKRLGRSAAEDLCRRSNQPPPMIVRVNTVKISLAALHDRLKATVQSVTNLPGALPGLVLSGHPPISRMTEYQKGYLSVQNAASMLVSRILDPQGGENILDVCSGTGTKTAHIAELMQNHGSITAVDIHAGKLARLLINCRRLGLAIIRTCEADATRFQESTPEGAQRYDRLLIDAPCSGLGVLRRHPEAKWTRQETQIAEFQNLQRQILSHLASSVRPGGILVYSTCTIEPEENECVVNDFLETRSDFRIDSIDAYLPEELQACLTPEGFLRIDPPQDNFDGFFCARLRRVP